MANFTITLPSNRKTVLTDVEMATKGFSHRFTVLYSDLINAGAVGATDTVTVNLGNTPAWWAVDKAIGIVGTAFVGSGGLTVAAGTSSTIGAFVTAASILTTGALPMPAALPILTNANGTTSIALQLLFTNSVSGSIATLTAGQVDIWIKLTNTFPGGGGLS